MSDLVYSDQSAKALRYALITESVDAVPFTVLKSGELVGRSSILEAFIIGASHILSVSFSCGQHLSEVFACMNIPSDTPSIRSGPLGDLQGSVSCKLLNGAISYHFTPALLSWCDGAKELSALQRMVEEAQKQDNQLGLSFEFPKSGTDERSPMTLVWASEISLGWRVHTAHCYPNEDTIVLTESAIDLEGGL